METPNLFDPKGPRKPFYYEEAGAAHSDLLRCDACNSLVVAEELFRIGSCPKCRNRKVKEIVALTPWEWFKIRFGILRFPHRKEFIREFSRS